MNRSKEAKERRRKAAEERQAQYKGLSIDQKIKKVVSAPGDTHKEFKALCEKKKAMGSSSNKEKSVEEWRLKFPPTSFGVGFFKFPTEWFASTLKMDLERDSKYRDMMENLFFKGGKVPMNESLPKDYRDMGMVYLRNIMGSWDPKHEDKEHVCALILKSLCE